MGGPHIAAEDMYCKYIARFVVELVTVVVVKINKAVVGSSHGDMPKYMGEGVALCRTPSTLGVPLPQCSCLSMAILGNFWVGALCLFIRFDYHQRPMCGWCLTRVGHDASSTSPGWGLLPLTVIIVLALVNSAVSPVGTLKYVYETQECCSTTR